MACLIEKNKKVSSVLESLPTSPTLPTSALIKVQAAAAEYKSTNLFNIGEDVLISILTFVDPTDITSLRATGKQALALNLTKVHGCMF